jgi:NAD-dependent SIR2 family protein deacetylase
MVARSRGARLVIINKDPTPLDPVADMTIRIPASEVLEAVA